MSVSKKISALSSLLILLFAGNSFAANSFDDAFKQASTSGQLRIGYISVAPDVAGNPTTTGAAFGGEIKMETAKWNRLQFAIAPYFVEKMDALSGDATTNKLNTDFLDANSQAFVYLGEAYINYAFNNGSVRIGRQKLDNPFINTDDIRMFSNTFNASWLNVEISKALTLEAGIVSSWAGFDSATATSGQDKFKTASNDGVTALGLNYKQSENFSGQAWYYSFDKSYSLLYADVNYTAGNLELGAQFGNYTEANNSGIAGNVLGASVTYSTGPFTFGAVINSGTNETGKSADLGLGGGNYYAAMDETTIAGLNDAMAHVLSFEYAATDKFTAALAMGHFEDNGKATNIDETDIVLGYSMNELLNLEFVYAIVDNKGNPTDAGTNFSRQFARATYIF